MLKLLLYMVKLLDLRDKIFDKVRFLIIFSLGIFFAFTLLPQISSAAVLLPGNISTCGELAAPGTYTLTGNVTGVSSVCFQVTSNSVVIDGAGFSVAAAGGNTSYAVTATSTTAVSTAVAMATVAMAAATAIASATTASATAISATAAANGPSPVGAPPGQMAG